MEEKNINAEVISVFPNKIRISVDNLEDFKRADETLRVGSYLKIADNENTVLMSIIENFSIEVSDLGERKYLIEANPLGILKGEEFVRGGDSIAIPPKKVEPATKEEIKRIYDQSIDQNSRFTFSCLSMNKDVKVPVDGNKFFNKHIAVIGSTGSGKSHTLATILQKAIDEKNEGYDLNNSHIILFDIHSEYKAAFPNANYIDIANLALPYWLLNSEEIEELFLDTDANDHNQRNILKEAIVSNRKHYSDRDVLDKEKIHYDTPTFFDLKEVLNYVTNRNNEKKNRDNNILWVDSEGEEFCFNEENQYKLFQDVLTVSTNTTSAAGMNGKLINFLNRLENKVNDKRFDFLLGDRAKNTTFEETLKKLLGYNDKTNITLLDLSGIPFEVLSITVSLVSRIIFEYGYFYKRLRTSDDPQEKINNDVPILLVYEEAHKYVPKSELTMYRSSKKSIERIAKEGRKYGITLMLASQRPSEISETIFSQCNNFIAMRLTNPNDQNYVKKLLPDTMGNLIDKMPSLSAGQALLIGESVVLPSVVQIDLCESPPSSNDIPYFNLWKEEWKDLDFDSIKKEWYK